MLKWFCMSPTNAELGEEYPRLHVCFVASVISTLGAFNL